MQPEPPPLRWHSGEYDESNFQIHGRTLYFIVALFSTILSINLLFLMFRWAWRRAFRRTPPPSIPLRHAPTPPPLRGLDPALLNNLPILLYKSSNAGSDITETECCICIGLFKEGDKMKMLPECKHCFHSECVDEWLHAHSSCPLCRASLV